MKTASLRLDAADSGFPGLPLEPAEVDLVLVFGARHSLEDPYLVGKLHVWFPRAEIAGRAVSGSGEPGVQILALSFGKVQIESVYRRLDEGDDVRQAGWEVGRELDADDLKVVLLFGMGSEGAYRQVAEGMLEAFGPCPPRVCPGLAGDSLAPDGEVLLHSHGLYRKGFLAVGLFGDRIEAEDEPEREPRRSAEMPALQALPDSGADWIGQRVVRLHEVAA